MHTRRHFLTSSASGVGLAALASLLRDDGLLASEPADPLARARHEAMAGRLRTELSAPGAEQTVQDIHVEIATATTSIAAAKERHRAAASIIEDGLLGIEKPSDEELAASIMSLQTRMQASYETTSILSKLSLSQYL